MIGVADHARMRRATSTPLACQKRVLERIHAVMKPKGLLYVGHSENFSDSRELFRLRGKTIYERV